MNSAELDETRVRTGGIRVFFRAVAEERFQVYMPTLGALLVSVISAFNGVELWRLCLWCALVASAETLLNQCDRRFARLNPADSRLAVWAWLKTGLVALFGAAIGSGAILFGPGAAPVALFAAMSIVVLFDGALTYSCAGFPPALVAGVAACTLLPAVGLGLFGQGLAPAMAACLICAFPFPLVIGAFAARNLRAQNVAHLQVEALLLREREWAAKLQEAQRERSRFFGAASHDLRQPLHALSFYASLIGKAKDKATRGELGARLMECAASLERQFNAILGMAETDHVVDAAKPEPTPLQTLFDHVEVKAAPTASLKGLRLRFAPTSLWVRADADALERALDNLVANALRYTEVGGVVVGARRSADSARIVVADSGVGVAEDELGRIFDDFYQIGNPERNREKGFGLGLAIVKRLAAAFGWQIDVRSTRGRGSLFSVSLPRAAPAPGAVLTAAELEAAPSAGRRLLLVEDDELVRDATARLLADWGFAVQLCRDGAEAFAALAERREGETWLVLLDQRLPGGASGLDVAARLSQLANPPLMILLTAETDKVIEAAARRLGVAVLRKPLKPARLRALLNAPAEAFAPARAGPANRAPAGSAA